MIHTKIKRYIYAYKNNDKAKENNSRSLTIHLRKDNKISTYITINITWKEKPNLQKLFPCKSVR